MDNHLVFISIHFTEFASPTVIFEGLGEVSNLCGTFGEIIGIENTVFGSADLDIFPNPTQQEFSIKFNSSINILDVNGKVMSKYDYDNNSAIITLNTYSSWS